MSSVGPNNPGTGVMVTGTDTNWINPGNITSSDNVYTTSNVSVFASTISNYLRARNFGFSIPSGATINGVVVEVEIKTDGGAGQLQTIVLSTNNAGTTADQIGTAKTPATALSTTDTYYTYGTSSDVWGATLTDSVVNSANFGVDLRVSSSDFPGRQFLCDHVRMTIYYTAAATGFAHSYGIIIGA